MPHIPDFDTDEIISALDAISQAHPEGSRERDVIELAQIAVLYPRHIRKADEFRSFYEEFFDPEFKLKVSHEFATREDADKWLASGHAKDTERVRIAGQGFMVVQLPGRLTFVSAPLEDEAMEEGDLDGENGTTMESERFYAVDEPRASRLAEDCREIWSLPDNARIGPINTNYIKNSRQPIELVVVCESPSFEELEHDHPAHGSTGLRILNSWLSSRGRDRLKKYQFDYRLLAQNGIYVTNLVRCQADWIPEDLYASGERLTTALKDEHVKDAWSLNRDFLDEELQQIARSYKNASVLFACGTEFDTQVTEATKFAEGAGLNWLVSFHPSRLAGRLSWHYNPRQWGDAQKTFPSERNNEKNRNQSMDTDSEAD